MRGTPARLHLLVALAVAQASCSDPGSQSDHGTATATSSTTGLGTTTEAGSSSSSDASTASSDTGPKDPGPPTELVVIDLDDMTPEEQTMIASLQGLLSRTSTTQIYVTGTDAHELWLAELREHQGVTTTPASGPWALVDQLGANVEGYILYAPGDSSINVASSLAGILDALPVADTIEAIAIDHGLDMVLDVRGRDEDWAGNNYWDQLHHGLVIEAKEEIPYHLRDLAAKERAMVFYDGTQDSPWRTGLMAALDDDAIVIGWGQSSPSETGFIINSGSQGVHYIPADWARNLSVLGELEPREQYTQNTHDDPDFEENVHYVTFMMSDGDNMQWAMNRGEDPRWWGSPSRGDFDMGWTFPPHMMRLAPTIFDWYYDTLSTGAGRDNLVVGPSGMGFFFPGDYPSDELDLHLERLDDFMGVADMGSVVLLGYGDWSDDALLARYTALSNVDGVFYFEWYDFGLDTHGRTIKWLDGKPVFSGGAKLFEQSDALIAELNSGSTDVYTNDAYTVVYVHAWQEPNIMDIVAHVVESLGPDVRVVSPEEIIKLAVHFRAP